MEDFFVVTPYTAIFAGSTGCGKTHLVKKIISDPAKVFDRPPRQIIICYDRVQGAYEEIKKSSAVPVTLIEGLPADLHLQVAPRTLLIIDDLQQHGELISDWFTKNSHHGDIDCIYICQNLFLKTPAHRTASLNAHIMVIFKNIRDKTQIMSLARQISPENPGFIMSAYKQATKNPYSYLMLNLKQETKEFLRVRDNFFPLESNYYVDKTSAEPFALS